MLKHRYAELSVEAEQLNKSIHLPQIDHSRNLQPKTYEHNSNNNSILLNRSKVHSPPKLLNVGPKEF